MSNLRCFFRRTRTLLAWSRDGHFQGRSTSTVMNACFPHLTLIHICLIPHMQIQLQFCQWQLHCSWYCCQWGDQQRKIITFRCSCSRSYTWWFWKPDNFFVTGTFIIINPHLWTRSYNQVWEHSAVLFFCTSDWTCDEQTRAIFHSKHKDFWCSQTKSFPFLLFCLNMFITTQTFSISFVFGIQQWQ